MNKLHNIFASLAVGAALVFTLAGCSGKDVALPTQLDMLPGESVALIDVAKYTGTEVVNAADTLKLLAAAQGEDPALKFEFDSDKPSVAKVSDQGVITAYGEGDANVTAACDSLDFKAEIAVHVRGYATALDIDDTARLEVDDTYALTTKVDGPATVVYESAAPAIASVDENGVITALRNGETTITARIPGSSLQDSCVVTIGTAVQSVSLSSAAATLAPGERMRLVAGTWPATGSAIKWSSDDETVATVKDGMVTALAAGTTEITATVGGKTAGCTVTVPAPATPETAATAETAATPETATPESAATPETAAATPETATSETAAPETAATPETAPKKDGDTTAPAEEEKAPALEDYILQFLDEYAEQDEKPADKSAEKSPEKTDEKPDDAALPALQYMGPGPVVPATPESATPETATAETASPETATPETATPETAENFLGEVAEETGNFFGDIFQKLGALFGFKP